MPGSTLLPRFLRNGVATACLVLVQLFHAGCDRERPDAAPASGIAWWLVPSRFADSLLGPDAGPIYAAMDKQLRQIREQGLADWALLDSLGTSPVELSSDSRYLPVILASLPPRSSAPGALERTTREHSAGPEVVNGATVELRAKETVWDEGGKLGKLSELRLTTTRIEDGATVRMVQQHTDRTEVKYCPDAQGVSPGTRELVVTLEVSGSGPTGAQAERGESRAAATLTGRVDDEAELTSVREEMEVKVRESSGSASRELKPVFGSNVEGASTGSSSIDNWELGEWQRKAPSDQVRTVLENTAIAFEGSVQRAYDQARDRWRNRRCVEVAFLEGNARRSVSPSDRIRIVAEARHKEDGSKLPAPLEASLVAYQSITPDRKRIPPPAEFIYQAPESGTNEAASMRERGARVYVTSTSRRGIGESEILYRLSTGPTYQVQMRVRQEAEKLGTTFDVTYQATLEPGPDGELQGSGSYRGTELSWKVACSDVDQDPNAEEHPVSGKLKATGSSVDMGGSTMLMFSLETLDFPPPPGWSGDVDEEVKGRGTVGNLGLTLTGNSATKTVKGEGDLMGFSSETPCTGKFSNTQETTVEVIR